MLDRLAVRDLPVTELAESFRMSLPPVSQHLKVLREAGLRNITTDSLTVAVRFAR